MGRGVGGLRVDVGLSLYISVSVCVCARGIIKILGQYDVWKHWAVIGRTKCITGVLSFFITYSPLLWQEYHIVWRLGWDWVGGMFWKEMKKGGRVSDNSILVASLAVHKCFALPPSVPAFRQFLDLFSSEYAHVLFFWSFLFVMFPNPSPRFIFSLWTIWN